MGKGIAKTRKNTLIASIHSHSWIRKLCTVDERDSERTRDTFKFDALPVDEPTKAARGLPPNPKIKITLSNFDGVSEFFMLVRKNRDRRPGPGTECRNFSLNNMSILSSAMSCMRS